VRAIHVLFVCTGNVYRSPMAEAFSRKMASDRGLDVVVESRGTLPGQRLLPEDALDVIGRRGADISGHRSAVLDSAVIDRADLVLGMEREHVRDVVLLSPGAWSRTFTLKEFVRRAEELGPRLGEETFGDWLERLGQGRTRDALMGWSPADDVADPMGMPPEMLRDTARELFDLVSRVVEFLRPVP
jgi:protein-tyrosine phosphatase